MSIIVPSNNTRIGARVTVRCLYYRGEIHYNSILYNIIPLIVMQGYHTNTKDTTGLDYNSNCYITSRIGWVSMKIIFK